MKIAVFFHGLFILGDPPEILEQAIDIIHEQMQMLKQSGLEDAAEEIHIGINGGDESRVFANFLPKKAQVVYHGLESRAENLTIVMLENWVKEHPDWLVCYFHAKGSTHKYGTDYFNFAARWRNCGMRHVVQNWRTCIEDLNRVESVGCHWMTGMGSDGSQNLWGGNFWWARSNFLKTVPSIYLRDRIRTSGISAYESRYESEVWIGNGRLPSVIDYAGHGVGMCP